MFGCVPVINGYIRSICTEKNKRQRSWTLFCAIHFNLRATWGVDLYVPQQKKTAIKFLLAFPQHTKFANNWSGTIYFGWCRKHQRTKHRVRQSGSSIWCFSFRCDCTGNRRVNLRILLFLHIVANLDISPQMSPLNGHPPLIIIYLYNMKSFFAGTV